MGTLRYCATGPNGLVSPSATFPPPGVCPVQTGASHCAGAALPALLVSGVAASAHLSCLVAIISSVRSVVLTDIVSTDCEPDHVPLADVEHSGLLGPAPALVQHLPGRYSHSAGIVCRSDVLSPSTPGLCRFGLAADALTLVPCWRPSLLVPQGNLDGIDARDSSLSSGPRPRGPREPRGHLCLDWRLPLLSDW